MDSHLDGRTGPQSYIEALPNIQGNVNKGLIYYTGWVGKRAKLRRKFKLSLPLVYHLKMDVSSIFDHKNKESAKYSYHVLYLE